MAMDLTLPVKCEMCGAAVHKEGAAVPKEAKRPPPDEDAAKPAAAPKPAKKRSWVDGERPSMPRCLPHGHGIGYCGDGAGRSWTEL